MACDDLMDMSFGSEDECCEYPSTKACSANLSLQSMSFSKTASKKISYGGSRSLRKRKKGITIRTGKANAARVSRGKEVCEKGRRASQFALVRQMQREYPS